MIPGEMRVQQGEISLNAGRDTQKLNVSNKGDRPIQIGSHYHFFEVNKALEFGRKQSFGLHLNIPAGTAVRFEPGDAKEVELVPFSGERKVYGLNNQTNGSVEREGTK